MESSKKQTTTTDSQISQDTSVDGKDLHIEDIEAGAPIEEKLPETVSGREALRPQPSNDPNDPLVSLHYI